MDETLFFILLVVIVLFFVTAAPFLLYAGIRKISTPAPMWIPLVLSVLSLLLFAVFLQLKILNTGDVLIDTLIYAVFLLLVIVLGVISAFPPFEKKIRIDPPWSIFPLLVLVGTYFLFIASLGESKEGGPLPWFSPLLPLTGWIIDDVTTIFHAGDLV